MIQGLIKCFRTLLVNSLPVLVPFIRYHAKHFPWFGSPFSLTLPTRYCYNFHLSDKETNTCRDEVVCLIQKFFVFWTFINIGKVKCLKKSHVSPTEHQRYVLISVITTHASPRVFTRNHQNICRFYLDHDCSHWWETEVLGYLSKSTWPPVFTYDSAFS